jgi:hypothetical protein
MADQLFGQSKDIEEDRPQVREEAVMPDQDLVKLPAGRDVLIVEDQRIFALVRGDKGQQLLLEGGYRALGGREKLDDAREAVGKVIGLRGAQRQCLPLARKTGLSIPGGRRRRPSPRADRRRGRAWSALPS